jgi:flagellar motor switch protein FliM
MEDRGGRLELLLPYATLEPIRTMLLQQFMGEKFGRDNIWEGHLASELWSTKLEVRAVLDEMTAPLGRMLDLKVGDTLTLDVPPDSPIKLKCGQTQLSVGRAGRINHKLAVSVDQPISQPARNALMKVGGGA